MPDADSSQEPEKGDSTQAGITRSEHARLRFGQGRPIAEVVNDVQRASGLDVFIQVDDDRFVVRGPRGREHIIEASGDHVTSVRRPESAHQTRLFDGKIRKASEDEFLKLKSFIL